MDLLGSLELNKALLDCSRHYAKLTDIPSRSRIRNVASTIKAMQTTKLFHAVMPELGFSWRRAQPRWLDVVAGVSKGREHWPTVWKLAVQLILPWVHLAGLRDFKEL